MKEASCCFAGRSLHLTSCRHFQAHGYGSEAFVMSRMALMPTLFSDNAPGFWLRPLFVPFQTSDKSFSYNPAPSLLFLRGAVNRGLNQLYAAAFTRTLSTS